MITSPIFFFQYIVSLYGKRLLLTVLPSFLSGNNAIMVEYLNHIAKYENSTIQQKHNII